MSKPSTSVRTAGFEEATNRYSSRLPSICGLRVRQRNPDLKTGITGLRLDLNVSPMLPDNPLHCVKAQARALADSLSGEEGLNNMRLYFGRNAVAVVSNLNYNAAVIAIGPDSKFTIAAHGINRVVDEVGPDLIEFTAERIHQQRNRLVIAMHSHAMLKLVVENRQGCFEALHDVDILHWRLVHEGVF